MVVHQAEVVQKQQQQTSACTPPAPLELDLKGQMHVRYDPKPPPPPEDDPPPYVAVAGQGGSAYVLTYHPPGLAANPVQGQVIVIQQQPVPVKESYSLHAALSCLVFWMCGGLFGGIAFLLAVAASRHASKGRRVTARHYGNMSLKLSVAGIVVGFVLLVIFCTVPGFRYNDNSADFVTTVDSGTTVTTQPVCRYNCRGHCFRYRFEPSNAHWCSAFCPASCYHNGYCYCNY
jgi:hypothetical protein